LRAQRFAAWKPFASSSKAPKELSDVDAECLASGNADMNNLNGMTDTVFGMDRFFGTTVTIIIVTHDAVIFQVR